MLIENWIAVIIVIFIFLVACISLTSGIMQDQRLEDERKKNDELQEENKELRKEVARLQGRINLARLYVEMGGKKE